MGGDQQSEAVPAGRVRKKLRSNSSECEDRHGGKRHAMHHNLQEGETAMEKIAEMVNVSKQAAMNVASSCTEPCGRAACEGCLALTGSNLCDLGRKTELVWRNNVPVGSRSLGECMKLNNIDDYLIEHLRKM